ncbi:hypothetical protein G352_10262 [Rhodococcus ruber BKS 20-38]|uniref:Uncharacterized protein n=1 Tax=Rhodococcus ruber BKS 20-38 TaxID=1278076 RepID=M2ZDJ8_9NOCA|nr:hypothetical protein [Rhodococcus ruber]EME65362.1 hypothetical protein G352_10262 [Rhodococcus ruber BKS 20-38]
MTDPIRTAQDFHTELLRSYPAPNTREYQALMRQYRTVPGRQATWPIWSFIILAALIVLSL